MALRSQLISLGFVRKKYLIAVCACVLFKEEQYLSLFYVLGNRNPHEQLLIVEGAQLRKMTRGSSSVQMPAGGRQNFIPLGSI